MKSSSWALCAAAVLAGDMSLQLLMTQPMAERVDSLSVQVSQLQTGIDHLTASAGNAMQTNDLLANLTTQGERTQGARAAIEQIRRFEREVRSQGHAVGHSMTMVQNIGRLHNEIITQSQQINELNGAIEDLSAFQQQVHGLTSAASREYVDVDRATQLVRELGQLKQDVAAQAKGIDGAIGSLNQLAALKQRATAEADDISGAFGGLDQLSALKQRAVTEAEDVEGAFGGLDQLASLKYRAMNEATDLSGAFGGLDQLSALKQRTVVEAKDIDGAFSGLDQLSALKQRAAMEANGIEQANNNLQQLGELKERVAVESDGMDLAETQFARLIGLKKSLELMKEQDFAMAAANIAGFAQLRDLIAEGAAGVETAIGYSRQMLSMQDELVERGGRVDVARKHADGLLSLEDALANDANLNIAHAQDNLHSLVALERQLNSQDEQIVAAVESLELMSDLQEEFMRRIGDLEGLRTGLTELAMLESSIVRTVHALQPLVELTSLRRLNGDDLQAIARGMMERRTSRIAAGDPHDLPLGDDLRTAGRDDANGTEEMLVPIPPTRQ